MVSAFLSALSCKGLSSQAFLAAAVEAVVRLLHDFSLLLQAFKLLLIKGL
jgi:hypothetical protein